MVDLDADSEGVGGVGVEGDVDVPGEADALGRRTPGGPPPVSGTWNSRPLKLGPEPGVQQDVLGDEELEDDGTDDDQAGFAVGQVEQELRPVEVAEVGQRGLAVLHQRIEMVHVQTSDHCDIDFPPGRLLPRA